MSTNLSINLKRVNKVYHEGEIIAGVCVVESGGEVRHDGLMLVAEGIVNLTLSSKHVGIFDAFSNNLKPITLMSTSLELAAAGRIPAGRTEIPFEVPMTARGGGGGGAGGGLLETYHGVFVSVTYTLRANMKRSFLNKPLAATCQFFVQQLPKPCSVLKPAHAVLCAPAAGGGQACRVRVTLHATVCALDAPLTGEIVVEQCAALRAVEAQLVRVETVGDAQRHARDATEVQNIEVACGSVRRGARLPLHVVLPRLFTCASAAAPHFKIEFELNIAVIFEDDFLVTENFPILLVRTR